MPDHSTMNTTGPGRKVALRGDLLDFRAEPDWGQRDSPAVRFQPDHWLLIDEAGRIAGTQASEPDASWQQVDHRGRLILPGFIDTHVHCPQLDVIASYGAELLDWLNRYTFPAERRYADPAVAAAEARGMRLITGKVLMDRHAPPELLDDVAGAERDCIDLIQRWHGRGRLAYAVTPRFAPTSSPAQLAMAGALCRAD